MDGPARSSSSPLRLRPAVVVATALALVWSVAYWQLSPLSPSLIQISRTGPRALLLYLSGKSGDAARAYRAGQHGQLRVSYADDHTGYWALYAGHADAATKRARMTLALVPGAADARVTLGEIALERDRPAEALAEFGAALRRRPGDIDALYLAAVALGRTGDPGGAIDHLNRALRSGSAGKRETIVYRIMELAGDLGRRAPAERPLCLLAHLHRYLRIFDERQGAAAMAYARQAIDAGDRPADAYLTLGVVHDKRGEYEAARLAMRRALIADPRHAEALRWLAVEAGKVGDLLVQHEMITRAFDAAPTDAFYFRDLEAVLIGKLGDPLGMATRMRRTLALDADNAEAHGRLARALGALGEHARARLHAERFVELSARGSDGR